MFCNRAKMNKKKRRHITIARSWVKIRQQQVWAFVICSDKWIENWWKAHWLRWFQVLELVSIQFLYVFWTFLARRELGRWPQTFPMNLMHLRVNVFESCVDYQHLEPALWVEIIKIHMLVDRPFEGNAKNTN